VNREIKAVTVARAAMMRAIAAEEAAIAAACATVAAYAPDAAEALAMLAGAHARAADRFGAPSGGWRERVAPLVARLAGLRGATGALAWLRDREHHLVRRYLELEGDASLDGVLRESLRREWVPAAFERFMQVDRLMARLEHEAFA
jgi:hypothetical protein